MLKEISFEPRVCESLNVLYDLQFQCSPNILETLQKKINALEKQCKVRQPTLLGLKFLMNVLEMDWMNVQE